MKESNISPFTLGDLLRYLGLWLLMSTWSGWKRDDFWSVTPLVRVLVLSPHPSSPWNVSRIEVLSFSILYRLFGSEIILVCLGSISVRFIVANMLLCFSVALLVRYYYKTSGPLHQSSFVLSRKLLKFEFGHDNIALKNDKHNFRYVIRYQ